jgi:hypothetical protein
MYRVSKYILIPFLNKIKFIHKTYLYSLSFNHSQFWCQPVFCTVVSRAVAFSPFASVQSNWSWNIYTLVLKKRALDLNKTAVIVSPLFSSERRTTLHSLILRKMPVSAPHLRAWTVHPPQVKRSSVASQQWLWKRQLQLLILL